MHEYGEAGLPVASLRRKFAQVWQGHQVPPPAAFGLPPRTSLSRMLEHFSDAVRSTHYGYAHYGYAHCSYAHYGYAHYGYAHYGYTHYGYAHYGYAHYGYAHCSCTRAHSLRLSHVGARRPLP